MSSKKSNANTSRTPAAATKSKPKATKNIVYQASSVGKPASRDSERINRERKQEYDDESIRVYEDQPSYVAARSKEVSDAILNRISKIINLPVTEPKQWHITSSIPEKGLYLVNAIETAPFEKYGWLRGVLVDTKHMTIIAMPYGVTPVVNADSILPDEEGVISVVDQFKRKIDFKVDDIVITPAFEGPQVTAVYHDGEFYLISRKQINSATTKWPGVKKSAREVYDELGGPQADDLFDTTKKYSPFSHTFIVSHPEWLVTSKQEVGPGYIVYVGSVHNWMATKTDSPYPLNEVDAEEHAPKTVSVIPDPIEEPFIYADKGMSLVDANEFLQYGWSAAKEDAADLRLGTGEAVVVHVKGTDDIYLFMSTALNHRKTIVGASPDHLFRFYQLMDDAAIDTMTQEGYEAFTKKYVDLPPVYINDVVDMVREGYVITKWPLDYEDEMLNYEDSQLDTHVDRLRCIWQNLFLAMPVARQASGIKILDRFFAERARLVSWIVENRTSTLPDAANIIRVIKTAEEYASREAGIGSEKNSDKLFEDAVRKQVEDAPSAILYPMIRYVRESEKLAKRQEPSP